MKRSSFHIILYSLLLGSCAGTSYWHSKSHSPSYYGSSSEEVHVTDSSFTSYLYEGTGCLSENIGSAEMRKSVIKGDTILTYEYRPIYPQGDSLNYEWKLVLYDAYIKKKRKLYFIYSDYPLVDWMMIDSMPIDSARIQKANVNWEGWLTAEAYIDFGGDYYKKGKNYPLRKLLKKNDSTSWHLTLPSELMNDTIIIRSHTKNKLGPMRKNGH
ncbi:MAG: hypothetical protein ACI8ZM_002101 [Crocinitomix sp.]|jgi:hypothetical protein